MTSTAYRQKRGQTLITASESMAVVLVDALRVIGSPRERAKAELVIPCATGVATIFRAMTNGAAATTN